MLYRYRDGDSNMVSVWICTRNDVIGNLAVLVAAAGVFGTGVGWPDFIVGAVMAVLALSGAWRVTRQAAAELGMMQSPQARSLARS
jgi:Co/Zn/Cd efflux system component